MSDHDGFGDRPWRVGRKVGRTVYDAHDRLIGVMDTPVLARLVVTGANALDASGPTEVPEARPYVNCGRCKGSGVVGGWQGRCPQCGGGS